MTTFADKVYAESSKELTANPKQTAITNLTVTANDGLDGSDTIDKAAALAAIKAAEGKINAILVALKAAGIIA